MPLHYHLTAQLAQFQLNSFKMLRSLTIQGVTTPGLENIKYKRNSIPHDIFKLRIGNLIHLRYSEIPEFEGLQIGYLTIVRKQPGALGNTPFI